MNGASAWARRVRAAEDHLRARGLTGVQALDALTAAFESRVQGVPPADKGLAAHLGDLGAPGTDDVLGLAYERLCSDVYKASRGQYFTPPGLTRLLWGHLPTPGPHDVVLDPTCGAGGLLAAAPGGQLRGVELDPGLARLARAQLAWLGRSARVDTGDVFRLDPEPADLVVANPPFSVRLDDPELRLRHADLAGPRGLSSDAVFLAGLAAWVAPGGHAAVLVPWSVLANRTAQRVRDHLRAAFEVLRVVALPEGVFRPFGGAAGKAAAIWLRRRPSAALRPWFRAVDDPGWDVRSRHLRATPGTSLADAARGEGFHRIDGAWLPAPPTDQGAPLSTFAEVVSGRGRLPRIADLSDVDAVSGVLVPRDAAPRRRLPVVSPGDLVFSRLRPELGVVAVHAGNEPVLGSAEWIVLRPRSCPWWLRHALRTPTFARRLTVTGQTRPRAVPAEVLAASVPAPSGTIRELVDAVSGEWSARHRQADRALRAIQAAVDAHAADELDDDGLRAAVAAVAPATAAD